MEKSLEDYKYWLTLGKNPAFTASYFQEIYALGTPIEEIFSMNESGLRRLGLSKSCVQKIIDTREAYKPDAVIAELGDHHIEPLFIFESDYPDPLREIYHPPFILYMRGKADFGKIMIGVVGSRKYSDYGQRATEYIAGEMAANGITVVSGMALGIDTIAHWAALNEGAQTIAVTGCGLDRVYPSTNLELAHKITENGAILSEYPLGTRPAVQNFPARNRIISGLSMGLLVTEAAEGSGSLITAQAALEQNREVFAVPGDIFNLNSFGTNNLIKMGAHPVTSAQDIFDEFGIDKPEIAAKMREILPKDENEKVILEILELEPKHIDEITKLSTLAQSEVNTLLTTMEITGKVKHLGGMRFRINN